MSSSATLRLLSRIGVVTAVLCTPALASAGWVRISHTSVSSNQPTASLVLSSSGVLAAFARPGLTDFAEVGSFVPSVTAGVTNLRVTAAAVGWAQIENPAAGPMLTPQAGGGVQMLLSGSHSTTTGDPLSGTVVFGIDPTGVVTSGPTQVTPSGNLYSAVLGPDQATTFFASNPLAVNRGLAATVSNDLTSFSPSTPYSPELGVDASGRLWLAWYVLGSGSQTGIWMLQIDPATGAAAAGATPIEAPRSSSLSNSPNFGLACHTVCRLVYHQSRPDGLNTGNLVSWTPGEASATVVASLASQVSGNSSLAAAYRSDGRLWVAWYRDTAIGDYQAKLGDARGAGGLVVDLGAPPGRSHGGGYGVSAIAYHDVLAVVVDWFSQPGVGDMYAITAPAAVSTSGITDPGGISDPNGEAVVPGHITSLGRGRCVLVRVQAYRSATLSVSIRTGRSGAGGLGVGRLVSARFAGPGIKALCVPLVVEPRGYYNAHRAFHFLFGVFIAPSHRSSHSRPVQIVLH